MILNFKKGSQILGKKIADLDTGEPTLQAPQQQTARPDSSPPQPTPALATPAPAAESQAPQPRAEDWGDLLVRLISTAPEDVAQKLVGCLDREVITKALEKKNDPYLKVALMLLTKK
jgi:hypothetical protein